MDAFAQAVTGWHDFYIMIGTASATLIGLLFVGMTINIEIIRRTQSRNVLQLAALTFNSFFYPLLFAVIFLIPDQGPVGLGTPTLCLGGLGLINMIVQFRRTRKSHHTLGRITVANRFIIPAIAMLAVVVIAISAFTGATSGFYWLVPAMILLLASATRNAWDLLVSLRDSDLAPEVPAKK